MIDQWRKYDSPYLLCLVILCHIIKHQLPYDMPYFIFFLFAFFIFTYSFTLWIWTSGLGLESVSFMSETPCSSLQLVWLVAGTGAPGVLAAAQRVLRHSTPFAADPVGEHICSNLCLSMSTCIHAYSCVFAWVCACVCACECMWECAFVNFGIAIDGLLSLLKMYAIKIVCALICEKWSCIFPRYAALSGSSLHSGTKVFFFTINSTCIDTRNSGWWITNNKVEFVFYLTHSRININLQNIYREK